jgi:type I restriction enzyme S subunit
MNCRNIVATREHITDKGVSESNVKPVTPGTLLISFKLSLGKVAFASIPLFTNEAIAALPIKDKNEVDAGFLYYALQTIAWSEAGRRAVKGNCLNKEIIEDTAVAFPLLDQQKRIAAILDKADRLRRTRRYARQLSDTFLQSVFLEMFGDPTINPRGWDRDTLENVCVEIYRYPTFYGFDYSETGTPVARIGNILSNGHLDPILAHYVFIDPAISKRFPRTILELNDIVMAVRGDGSTAKRIALVSSENLVGANISPNLLRFKTNNKKMHPFYLFRLMVSDSGQALLERYITRTAKKTITAEDIKAIVVPVPPPTLQEQYVDVVRRHERLRAQQAEAERQAEHLFQTLLHRSFRGELPGEEKIPASEMAAPVGLIQARLDL